MSQPDHRISPRRAHPLTVLLRELGRFFRASFGSLFSLEFITVLIPLLIVWEILPRTGWVPETLLPAPSKVAAAFARMLTEHNLLQHLGASLGRFTLGLLLALITALPIGVLMG